MLLARGRRSPSGALTAYWKAPSPPAKTAQRPPAAFWTAPQSFHRDYGDMAGSTRSTSPAP